MSARKRRSALAAAAGIAVAYLLLVPLPLEKELVMEPVWVLDTAGRPARSSGAARPFLSGGRVGYHDATGELLFSEPVLHGAAVGQASFINYPRLPSSLVVKDPRGLFVAAIPAGGYPLLDAAGERVLLVSADAKGLTGVSRSGEILWKLELASVITALDFGDAGVLVGLLDGTLALYDFKGRLAQATRPEGSRIPVILGCAAGGDRLACVSGIDPQRLVVGTRAQGRFQPFVSVALSSDFRREVLVRFSVAGDVVFHEAEDGLGLLDLRSRTQRRVALPGAVRALAEAPRERLWAALHAEGGAAPAGLRIYQAPDRLVARERLPAGADFLAGSTGGFVVGFDGRLARVEARHE